MTTRRFRHPRHQQAESRKSMTLPFLARRDPLDDPDQAVAAVPEKPNDEGCARKTVHHRPFYSAGVKKS
jgi:hypothetical protein